MNSQRNTLFLTLIHKLLSVILACYCSNSMKPIYIYVFLIFVTTFYYCFLKTSLSVDAILKHLKKGAYDVMISDDAGRFVCNYVYYHSLRFAEQKGNKSLFVHVPLFSRIDEETQMRFTASLLEAIASAC